MARGSSDQILTVGSVEIDVATLRVGILRIDSFEPEDPRQNKVLVASVGGDLPGPYAALENAPQRGRIANLLADPETSDGCLEAAFLCSKTELGSGNPPRMGDGPIPDEINSLVADFHDQELAFGKTHRAGTSRKLAGKCLKRQ